MRKLIVSQWITLDGIYDADTMEQWEVPYNSEDKWNAIKEGILSREILLIGKTTYEMFASFWPKQKNNEGGVADKMNNMRKVVISSTLKNADWNNTVIIGEDIFDEIGKLKQQQGGDIHLSGSATLVQSLIETGLIDEYEFFVHPIIMGTGKRCFNECMTLIKLNLVETKKFHSGVILLCYQPTKEKQI